MRGIGLTLCNLKWDLQNAEADVCEVNVQAQCWISCSLLCRS